LDSGFEKTIGRFGPHMEAIFQCRCLMGLEITRKEDAGLYTDADDSTDHKHLLEVWRGVNDNKLHRDFAKLMSSDSHELVKLGNNINGNNRLTRIKMASLTFRSFKLAFLSSESRVRLEDYLPEQRPIITHVKLEGELLDGVDIELSPNLTCIIGSRGAGKSTLLESIRETTGDESKSKLRDSDVWPQTALIDYIDEAGQHLQLQRDKHGSVVNRTDPTQGITSIPIESYGQGETANTIQHSDENPQVIIDFLDSFLSLSALKQQDDLFVEQLRSNQSEMNKLRVNLIALPAAQKNLENEKAKLKKLEQTKAADIVKYHNALIQERELRKSLIGDLRELVKTYSEILANRDVFDKVAAISEENIVVGKDFFANVKAIVNSFAGIVAAKSQELKEALKLKVDELNVQLQAWNSKEKEIQDKIDAKKEELTKQGIPFDLGQINQISKDIVDYDKTVKKLLDDQKKLKELQVSRKSLISARIDNKKEITRQHLLFADKINRDLRNSVDDFFITVKYQENLHAPDFAECLKQMMGWRTSQVPKANIIAQSITIFDFIKAVCNNDFSLLRAIQYNGSQLLNDGDIAAIFQTLRQDFQYESLECLRFDD
ncbi:MAG: histidinol-phosphatase, partial [Bacteroidaceae bacterium]|nr:histidinol-phosphatase [Bacteroidaceae bacterium]